MDRRTSSLNWSKNKQELKVLLVSHQCNRYTTLIIRRKKGEGDASMQMRAVKTSTSILKRWHQEKASDNS